MTKYVVGSKILKKEQVLISIFIVAILLLSSGSMVAFASGGHTIVVPPSHDTTGKTDTAAIQAALNACTKGDPHCTVQLLSGTYYISSQITVYGFQGSFVGAGQGQTIIEAPYSLPPPAAEYNTATSPFWAGLPGSSNPWPNIFTFVGGSFSISGMTITDPNTAPISSPGWYAPDTSSYWTSLYAAIDISGGIPHQPQASASIDHVTVVGAPGDVEGTNMWNGIIIGGSFLPPGYTNPLSQTILISGTFSVTNSVFNTMASGPWVGEFDGATVTVCYNTAINTPGITYGFFDSYNSKLTFCGNRGSAGMFTAVLGGFEDVYVPPPTGVSPSTVYITGNNFHASQGANVVALGTYSPVGLNPMSAVVTGNTFTVDSTCTPTYLTETPYPWCYNDPTPEVYYSAVYFWYLTNVVFSQNTIFAGGASTTPLRVPANGIEITGELGTVSGNIITGSYNGVWVDAATNIQVTHNTVMGSTNYGIALLDTSSSNVVAHNIVMHSSVYDLYQDASSTGTGNVWSGNICQTSSPTGLC